MDYQEASKLRERSKKMYGLTVILMLTYTLISIFIIKQTTGGQAWYWGLLKASPCVVLMSNVLLRLTGRPNATEPRSGRKNESVSPINTNQNKQPQEQQSSRFRAWSIVFFLPNATLVSFTTCLGVSLLFHGIGDYLLATVRFIVTSWECPHH